jgi:hypothetical protein
MRAWHAAAEQKLLFGGTLEEAISLFDRCVSVSKSLGGPPTQIPAWYPKERIAQIATWKPTP